MLPQFPQSLALCFVVLLPAVCTGFPSGVHMLLEDYSLNSLTLHCVVFSWLLYLCKYLLVPVLPTIHSFPICLLRTTTSIAQNSPGPKLPGLWQSNSCLFLVLVPILEKLQPPGGMRLLVVIMPCLLFWWKHCATHWKPWSSLSLWQWRKDAGSEES